MIPSSNVRVSSDQFLELVERSQLVEQDALRRVRATLRDSLTGLVPEDPRQVAAAFIDAELLTKWQANMLLRGKHKVMYSPYLDNGDFVVVVNAEKVRLTGNKLEQKFYRRHSGYPGGFREASARKVLETHPDRILREAVRGMLPKGALGRQMLRKLKVYVGPNHPHAAQTPEALDKVREVWAAERSGAAAN